mmetsp:Transcript_41297/g.89403  ORF Transcript_41297/g.89403 Transcript_41297/m.89403 type:complete len:230 (+) Transcript_41297:133-822(+)
MLTPRRRMAATCASSLRGNQTSSSSTKATHSPDARAIPRLRTRPGHSVRIHAHAGTRTDTGHTWFANVVGQAHDGDVGNGLEISGVRRAIVDKDDFDVRISLVSDAPNCPYQAVISIFRANHSCHEPFDHRKGSSRVLWRPALFLSMNVHLKRFKRVGDWNSGLIVQHRLDLVPAVLEHDYQTRFQLMKRVQKFRVQIDLHITISWNADALDADTHFHALTVNHGKRGR